MQTNLCRRRTQHALARDDDLLRLLLDGQRAHERGDLLGRLPLRELPQTLLTGPDARVDDFEEELARARVEDEDRAVCKRQSVTARHARWKGKGVLMGLVVKLPSNVL